MKKITIIGGGASGILLAANLIKHAGTDSLEVNLIEKTGEFGRGIAYGTQKDFHLLNVPAAKMGAFPDAVEHFHQWLTANGYDYAPGSFVSRKLYGTYLREVFADALARKSSNVAVNVINDEAVDVIRKSDETKVLLRSNKKISADKIVLAFGNFLPPHVRTETNDYIESPKYFQNPWRDDIPAAIPPDETVLIIGTGLTAIDVILSLSNNEHRGMIFALSTHGLFPTVHAPAAAYPSFQTEMAAQTTTRGLVKIVHRHLKHSGENWRGVIDSLRPFTQEIWFNLPPVEKRRFMRHLQRRWDVSRHRMPPECWAILQDLQTSERLQVLSGRIRKIELTEKDDFAITFGKNQNITADRIINCTGSQSNYTKIAAPLIKNLLASGEIKPDALSLGLDAAATGEIIGSDNQTSNVFYTFANAQKGILWECTAMPDIRTQADKLARRLLAQ